MIETIRALLGANLLAIEPAGSRVTCNPTPMNTDEDYILHVAEMDLTDSILTVACWEFGGSRIPADANYTAPDEWFASYRLGDVNLIVTASEAFYQRFLAATYVAKRLNLLVKYDRIALFQAVLYGRQWDEKDDIDLLLEAP